MLRSLHVIAAAINLSAPSLPDSVVDVYAETVQAEALDHELDPFLMVAIVRNESRWHASAEDRVAGCLGLGGICLDVFPACRPHRSAEACQTVRLRLLQPGENLRVAAAMLEANREYCEARFRGVRMSDWVEGYQGAWSSTRQCGRIKVKGKWKRAPLRPVTRRVMRWREMLERRLIGKH